MGDGKGSGTLDLFWKRLRASKAKVDAVATDMSPAYISAVMENLPKAALVFDRFHVMKLYNDKLNSIRRQLQSEVECEKQKRALKGTRWLMQKNKKNLNNKNNETKRLEKTLELNKPLAKAYYLKDELREFWNQDSKSDTETWLNDWIKATISTKIKQLMTVANTMASHCSGLLAWYKYPISTGPLEGTNNKI